MYYCRPFSVQDEFGDVVLSVVQELSNATISQWKKEAMRSSLNQLKKTLIDADKSAKAKLVQQVSDCRGGS